MITPATIEELAEAVRTTPRLLAVGAQTKPRLCATDAELLSTTKLSGIIDYDPGEFTFTALAGTPVRDIAAALAAQGQYLPFDPMLVEAGSTLGGTVAAGLSGPGRFRYGGVRDFILGVRFVDGMGRVLRMGGKVVKNAAGFDLPKFFVGSLGRFGVLAEMTFKVFPRASATRTLRLELDHMSAAVRVVKEAARTRWEPDALEILPDGRTVLLRLAAPEPALDAISSEVLARWPGSPLTTDEAIKTWSDIAEFRWAGSCLVKAPVTPDQVPALHQAAEGVAIHISAGGNVAYLSAPVATMCDHLLCSQRLRGVTLRGDAPLWPGGCPSPQIWQSVKQALDPHGRFPSSGKEIPLNAALH